MEMQEKRLIEMQQQIERMQAEIEETWIHFQRRELEISTELRDKRVHYFIEIIKLQKTLSFLVIDSVLYLESLSLIFKELFLEFFNPQRLEKLAQLAHRTMNVQRESQETTQTRRKCLEETKHNLQLQGCQDDEIGSEEFAVWNMGLQKELISVAENIQGRMNALNRLKLPPEETDQTACFNSMQQVQIILDELEQFKKDNFTREDKDCIIFMLLQAQNANTVGSRDMNQMQARGATIEVEDDKMEEIEAMEQTALARDHRSLRTSQFYLKGSKNRGGPRHLTTLLDEEIKRNQEQHLVAPLMASTQQYIKLDDMLPEEKKVFPKFFLPKETDLSLFEQLRLQEGGTAQALEMFDQIQSSRQRQQDAEDEHRAIAIEACEEMPSQRSAFNLRKTLKQTEREILEKFIKEMPATVQVLDDSYSRYKGGVNVQTDEERDGCVTQGLKGSMLPTLKSPSPLHMHQEELKIDENEKSEEKETESRDRTTSQVDGRGREGEGMMARREIKWKEGSKASRPPKKKMRRKSGCFCLGNYK